MAATPDLDSPNDRFWKVSKRHGQLPAIGHRVAALGVGDTLVVNKQRLRLRISQHLWVID